MKLGISILIFFVYIYFTYKFQIVILKTNMLNSNQKKINSILIWLIPFLWFWLIKGFIKPSKTITKKDRDKKKGSFYESGIGISG